MTLSISNFSCLWLLCILTTERVLHMPFAGQYYLFSKLADWTYYTQKLIFSFLWRHKENFTWSEYAQL